MRLLCLALCCAALAGCGSTPKRDDYAAHINTLKTNLADASLTYSFSGEQTAQIRGYYNKNDATGSSPVLYSGAGGLAGMLVQVGVHAAVINHERDSRLAKAQMAANEKVAPLQALAQDVTLQSLIGSSEHVTTDTAGASATVMLRPLFFSHRDMKKLGLKLVAWIESSNGRTTRYQNLVNVSGISLPVLDLEQPDESQKAALKAKMALMLQTAVQVLEQDIRGQYLHVGDKMKTYLVPANGKRKAVRGELVGQSCSLNVVRDLRSWFYIFEKATSATSEVACENDENNAFTGHSANVINIQ